MLIIIFQESTSKTSFSLYSSYQLACAIIIDIFIYNDNAQNMIIIENHKLKKMLMDHFY